MLIKTIQIRMTKAFMISFNLSQRGKKKRNKTCFVSTLKNDRGNSILI